MAGHYDTLALFPLKVREQYRTRGGRPHLVICPICKTVFRRDRGLKYGCSPACSLQARFWQSVEKTETCWLWHGEMGPGGYGRLTDSATRKRYMAHRYSYELHVGPVPEGLCLDHLCRVRSCVRPDHLEAVTMRENTMRGDTPARRNHEKTACIHGHPYDETNTSFGLKGRRHCRQCRKRIDHARWVQSQQRKKALTDGDSPTTTDSSAETGSGPAG